MQEIAVFAIVAVAAAYVVWTVVDRLRSKRRACASGCDSCRRCPGGTATPGPT
jgi:hypothetical protein